MLFFLLPIIVLKIIFIVLPVLVAVAYFTIAERKFIGTVQRRKGPNAIGFLGLLQPLADGLKLFTKETILPKNSSKGIFNLAPVLTFILSLINWAVIPFSSRAVYANASLGSLYLIAVSSVSVYGILIAGWSSNSKYSFLGAIRSAAQLISYEITMSFIVITICGSVGSLNLISIILVQRKMWFLFFLLPIYFVFCISILAETNRHPFDLPEAEAELVSGYNVEYSSMVFALFFLGEYASMLLMGSLVSTFFFGGWLAIPLSNIIIPIENLFFYAAYRYLMMIILPSNFCFSLKISLIVLFFIITRASLPRYRYDQLMSIGWKSLLPFVISYFILIIGTVLGFQLINT